jgi:hypothetical protein
MEMQKTTKEEFSANAKMGNKSGNWLDEHQLNQST